MPTKSFSASPPPGLKPSSWPSPDSLQPHLSDFTPVGQLIQYWCAVAVADELHFTRAAHRLHMDQSALSRHVQKLEASLGFKLFIRGERRIELTEAAEVFIPFARKALLAAKAGVLIAQATSRGEPAHLEVAYSTVVDTHLVAQVKALVEEGRPRIPVRFRSLAADQLPSYLFEGAGHAAITLLPVEEEVAAVCLQREDLFVVVPSAHSFARERNLALGQIGGQPVIWPAAMPVAFSRDLFLRFRKAGYVPNVTHEAQTTAESLGLVREGFGVTFIKTSDCPLVSHDLKVLPLATPFPVETGLLYIPERRWEFLGEFVTLVTNRFHCTEEILKSKSGPPLAAV